MNRRQFLLQSGFFTSWLTGLYGKLALATQHVGVSSEHEDYKALVCIFLHGGNDSFNMLIPTDKTRYTEYQKSRSSVALDLNSSDRAAIPLNQFESTERYALHPSCGQMADLYNAKKLAFIANVGNLIEPTSIDSVLKGTARLPSALFSHNDQRSQWQSGLSSAKISTGWLGRAADVFYDNGSNTSFSMNVSLSGSNLMQTGRWVVPYSITPEGPVNVRSPRLLDALKSTLGTSGTNDILEQVFATTQNHAFERNQYFSKIFNKHQVHTAFPDTALGNSLRAIATTIASNKTLGQTRQTFFVMHRGWDTHQEQEDRHPYLLAELSAAVHAFDTALTQMKIENNVTTFTASEFGRTLRSNGRGTDHGWGGVSAVAGGAVNGGNVFGEYPQSMALGAGMDIGKNGRLLPSLSTDQLIAPLLRWFGLGQSQLFDVLPNLAKFDDASDKGSLSRLFKAVKK